MSDEQSAGTGEADKRCTGTGKDGMPCRNRPIADREFCRWHSSAQPIVDPETTEGFMAEVQAGRRFIWEAHFPPDSPEITEMLSSKLRDPDPWLDALKIVRHGLSFDVFDKKGAFKGNTTADVTTHVRTVFHAFDNNSIGCLVRGHWLQFPAGENDPLAELLPKIRERNARLKLLPPKPFQQRSALVEEVPRVVPQITAEEPRILAEAISHGRTGKGWVPELDGALRVFQPRPNGHEVRLKVYNAPEEWGAAELSKRLDATLTEWDLDAAFLALTVIGTLADGTLSHAAAVASGNVTPVADLDVDDLLKSLGKRRNAGSEKWDEWRKVVRRRLLQMSGAVVVGERRGKYRVEGSREEMDTYSEEALFYVIDAETTWKGSQLPLDGSGIPLRLRIHGGGLFKSFARNRSMLQHIGNLRALAERIPGGQASGQWARAMALSFAQYTREEAAKKRPRRTFTREELLTRIPPVPTLDEVLNGEHPRHALSYWSTAKSELVLLGWWRDFAEPPKPPARYGWAEEWRRQEVSPEPGPLLSAPLPELAAEGEEARQREQRGPRKAPR